MATLTYWKATSIDDCDAMSIRAKTRTEALSQIEADPDCKYEKPEKITITYQDSFDLMQQCNGFGGAE